jgi:tRNA-specific 2-thiouridylase
MPKPEVRAIAAELDLATAERPESQDICFVPDRDYRSFVKSQRPMPSSPAISSIPPAKNLVPIKASLCIPSGNVKAWGSQSDRRCLSPALMQIATQLWLCPAQDLRKQIIHIDQTTYVGGTPPDGQFRCMVQSRSHADAAPAMATVTGERSVTIEFDTPKMGFRQVNQP